MDSSSAPLFEALRAYAGRGVIPFHTPGHKLAGEAFPLIRDAFGSRVFALDPSDEVECPRCSHQFEAVLAEAELLAADLFGAKATRFLVNGTTSGIHSVCLTMTGKVLIPRFSHQSVYEGLILSGLPCAYLPTRFAADWGIPLPPTPQEIVAALDGDQHITNVFLANPTYYGSTSSLDTIVGYLSQRGIALAVDEAHGGHFDFSAVLPMSGREAGADWAVHSTHKVLGSLTQTSMLHVYNESRVKRTLESAALLETTSPSLVFLAVLDAVRRELAVRGKDMIAGAVEMAEWVRSQLALIPRVSVLGPPFVSDPLKLVFSLCQVGLSGVEVENMLRSEYNIQVELSDAQNVLAVVGLGDSWRNLQALVEAISQLVNDRPHADVSFPALGHLESAPPLPVMECGLREAFLAGKTSCLLRDSVNRTSGGFVTPYPPGVPLLVPGERISGDAVEYLRRLGLEGIYVRGCEHESLSVLED